MSAAIQQESSGEDELGQHNVAIYDGSMNEWTSDPTCPVIRKYSIL
ncbi:hypothetical protein [Planomicrobium sp. YIM 101495]|nr:hypothetical protein [Planomicrobium sp. YIM 101495]MTD31977.1 hypothetical protein [Planomicrobium sp. YIM 101495]